ncbi:MAG: hypothetical protein ACYTEQ_05200 [Planctomycetota bacterium]|jgi:hypothetical protein
MSEAIYRITYSSFESRLKDLFYAVVQQKDHRFDLYGKIVPLRRVAGQAVAEEDSYGGWLVFYYFMGSCYAVKVSSLVLLGIVLPVKGLYATDKLPGIGSRLAIQKPCVLERLFMPAFAYNVGDNVTFCGTEYDGLVCRDVEGYAVIVPPRVVDLEGTVTDPEPESPPDSFRKALAREYELKEECGRLKDRLKNVMFHVKILHEMAKATDMRGDLILQFDRFLRTYGGQSEEKSDKKS